MTKLYRSSEGRADMRAVTEKFRARVSGVVQKDHYISTKHGDTHVWELGDSSLPPLVVVHGAMTNHAIVMDVFRHLIGRYHIFVPDIPGHAGWSDEVSPKPKSNEHGEWLLEVLDQMRLERPKVLGLSYGGFVINRLIALAPERVEKAAFFVPAGFVDMPLKNLFTVVLGPFLMFKLTGSDKHFRKFMDGFFTDCDDELMLEFFKLMMTQMTPIDSRLRLTIPQDTEGFTAPVYVLANELDIAVDVADLKKRVDLLYPQAEFEVQPGQKHTSSLHDDALRVVAEKIARFFDRDEHQLRESA